MEIKIVDLYKEYGLEKPEGAVGRLICYIQDIPNCVGTERESPAMLILPGGAYRFTSEREAEPIALRFLAKGYCAFVLHYSCAPLPFPHALREAVMAMGYIRRNSEAFRVNPNMVAAMGFSAGGHLCGTLATMYDCPEVADLGLDGLTRPDAVALCYPVAVSHGPTHEESFDNVSGGDPALRRRLSLDALVRPDMPPVFLWHTRDDGAVPVRNSLVLSTALDAAGVSFTMHIYAHGNHGLSNADDTVYPTYQLPETSWDVPNWVESLQKFLAEQGFRIIDKE